jgi:hypothetical protein
MKLWIDDVRPAPEGYVWCHSVYRVIKEIELFEMNLFDEYYIHNTPFEKLPKIEVIDIDHDAGEYFQYGGDYIKLLDWLEETGRNYPIHIHSMNPVGVQNMRAIIQKNGWTEI